MRERILNRLHEYIKDNHPDLLLHLLEENRLDDYLREQVSLTDEMIGSFEAQQKSASEIEDICLDALANLLGPSRHNYLLDLLRYEFPEQFEKMEDNGTMTPELINMIAACDPVFDEMKFSEENMDDRYLRYAVIGAVHEYLNE